MEFSKWEEKHRTPHHSLTKFWPYQLIQTIVVKILRSKKLTLPPTFVWYYISVTPLIIIIITITTIGFYGINTWLYFISGHFRYSLNGKPGYVSGGSTMNSTRSMSTNSDHYAIVHSRPGSRYSGTAKHQPHMRGGPPSNIGSHYSGKM